MTAQARWNGCGIRLDHCARLVTEAVHAPRLPIPAYNARCRERIAGPRTELPAHTGPDEFDRVTRALFGRTLRPILGSNTDISDEAPYSYAFAIEPSEWRDPAFEGAVAAMTGIPQDEALEILLRSLFGDTDATHPDQPAQRRWLQRDFLPVTPADYRRFHHWIFGGAPARTGHEVAAFERRLAEIIE